MANPSIPPLIAEGGNGEAPSKKQTGNERAEPKHDDAGTRDINAAKKTESTLYCTLAFATFECFGVYFWQIADGVSGFHIVIFHWISLCCLVAGIFAAAHQIIEDKEKRWRIWSWFITPCIVCFFVADSVWSPKSPIIETNASKWLPPELPPGCSNVSISFGNRKIDVPIWMAKIPHNQTGTNSFGTNYFVVKVSSNLTFTVFHGVETDTNEEAITYAVKDMPDSFVTNVEQMPDYSPRKRHFSFGSQFMRSQLSNGKTVDYPVWAIVISNHLFVDVIIPFINERHRILMDTNMDIALTNLPNKWDINYNSNKFEIVNEETNPVLQVIYKSASEVLVNGVYLFNYDLYEAFDAPDAMISQQVVFGNTPTQRFAMSIEDFEKTFTNVTLKVD